MLQQVSLTVNIIFIILAIFTVYIFYKACNYSKTLLLIICVWMIVQLILGISRFYKDEFSKPPGFGLLLLPPLVLIIIAFISRHGKKFIDDLDIKLLTILHSTRIVVEVILYVLFIDKTIPQIMTFEGFNFDILAGLTAPLIYYLVFTGSKFSKPLLFLWNILSLALLLNIIVIAFLSLKTPFQQFGFDQPNIALNYFPFVWLPSVIVPVVLFSHMASIRQLLKSKLP